MTQSSAFDTVWFCFLLQEKKVADKTLCEQIVETLRQHELEPSIDLITQMLVENNLCTDTVLLDDLAMQAQANAKKFGPCNAGILKRVQTTEAELESASAEEETAPAPVDPTAWLKGWPNLNDAKDMRPDAARDLLNVFLHKAREANCSDVHISAGARPFVRKYKRIFYVEDQEILSQDAARELNLAPLNDAQRAHFDDHHDLDYAYTITSTDRYRTNLLHQRFGISGSYRIISNHITPIAELGFQDPQVIEKLTTHNQGLILITGPAGSGKSTTLSSLVEFINRGRHDHIVCVEDPIEIIYQPQGCNITQRELNLHTKSFSAALRAALREDPDVIVVGELRDLETIEMAIHASETGHLVFGTLHTSSAADTMSRLLDVFPHSQQAQIRAMVAESLKAVICQQLLPTADGNGVALAYEIMLGTLAISSLIREGKTYQINSSIQTSRNLGMITMEQSHFDLYMRGLRSYEQTIPYIRTPDLKAQMARREATKFAPTEDSPAENTEEQQPAATEKKWGWF